MIVTALSLHEAAHGVIALATGGGVTCLRIGDREGLASTDSPTTIGRLMTLCAGQAAEFMIAPFEAPDTPATPSQSPRLAPECGTISDLASLVQNGERGDTVACDGDQFYAIIKRLVAEGKIAPRFGVCGRWWDRCAVRVRRMLAEPTMKARVMRVAEALQREGALFGARIQELVKQEI